MKKLFALFGILALAACGGGDAETATVEDTTVVAPAAETAPVVVPPIDTTMAAPMATPMDSTAGTMSMGDTMQADSATM